LKQFGLDNLQTLTTRVITMLLSMGTSIAIARALGPADRGTWAVMSLISTVALLLINMGLDTSAIYFIGKKTFPIGEVIFTLLICGLLLGLCAIAVYGLASAVSEPFRNYLAMNHIGSTSMWVLMIITPLGLIAQYLTAVILGLRNFKLANLVALSMTGLTLVLTIIFLYLFRWGIEGLVVTAIISSVPGLGIVLGCLLRDSAPMAGKLRWNLAAVRAMLRYGLKTYFGNLVWFISYRADMFLISIFLTTAALGYYSISVGLAEKLYIIPSAVGTVLFPYVASTSHEEAQHLTLGAVHHTILVVGVLSLGLWIASYPIVYLLYGAEYLPAWQPFVILVPAVAVLSIGRVISSDLNGRGHPGPVLVINLIAGALNVGLNLWLLPLWGIAGAATASLVSYTLAVTVEVVVYGRITKIHPYALLVPQREDWLQYVMLVKRAGKYANAWLARVAAKAS
jgi:O-antigen/teichoic acid export membrane protein